jgi:hypothetical protein
MVRARLVGPGLIVCGWLLLLAPALRAQQTLSGLAGVVRDAMGAPIPGVTVEASSPALIERVRSVVTDANGQYKLIELQPGSYSVTFRANGFAVLTHEGIDLPAGFTGTVNGVLTTGGAEQTITVTGAVPLIDTRDSSQASRVSETVTQSLASALPGATSVANVTTGLTTNTPDVGGATGSYNAQGGTGNLSIRGKAGVKRLFDGLRIENLEGSGNAGYMLNSSMVAETVVETGGGNAESLAAGGMINNVPKSGSNVFHAGFTALYTNESLQANNLDAALQARGLTSTNRVDVIYDAGITLGGPFIQDKLWYFGSVRYWGNRNFAAGIYWDKTEGAPLYVPDLSRPADQLETQRSNPVRLTWQATDKQKWNFFVDYPERACTCRFSATTADPEATIGYHFTPEGLFQASWSSPRTKKLLLEGGWSYALSHWPEQYQPGVTPTSISTLDLATNFRYNAMATYIWPTHQSDRMAERFSATYVTGSHAFKVGFQMETGWHSDSYFANENVNYNFLNGVPNQVVEWATPYLDHSTMKADLGIYAQDQWTLKRLTLNYGVRYSYFNAGIPAESVPATEFVPFNRSFGATNCVPCWNDIDPRFGAAYDLFGNGRSAIKFTAGRFVNTQTLAIANANNPIATSVNSATRSWNDTTNPASPNYYVPNCNLQNPAANGDCGPINNSNFGGNNPLATVYSPSVINGWGARDHIWDFGTEFTQQVTPKVSILAGYYRNIGENFTTTDNAALSPAAYSPYCVTAPTDPRLPGGGGQQICGLYDVAPALFSAAKNVVTQASQFGTETQVNQFVTFQVNARVLNQVRLGGGVDAGRQAFNNCFTVYNPEQANYNLTWSQTWGGTATAVTDCNVVIPWSGTATFKGNGSFPLPMGFSVNATYQNSPGAMITANYLAPNSAIVTSLGRPLAACGTKVVACTQTASVPLIQPGTEFEARRSQLDLRFSKALRLGPRLRVQGNFDIYNVFNNNAILSDNVTYGSQWLKPTSILSPRLIEFGGRVDF